MFWHNQNIVNLILTLIVFVFSITLHEVAHGYAAYKLGDPTAKNMGRLTLNPLAHLDPIGTLLLLFAGFGWAKPVPINSRYFKHTKRDLAIVSVAGPLSNLVLSFVSLLILIKAVAPMHTGGIIADNIYIAAYTLLVNLASLNVTLAVFNLIPIPPLDGSKLLVIFAPYKWRDFIFQYERYGMLILFVLLTLLSGVISSVSGFVFNGFVRLISMLPF